VGKGLQLEEDRIVMEEYRRQLRLLKEKVIKGRNQMVADIMTRFAVFQTELEDICAVADLGGVSSDEPDSLSEEYVSISCSFSPSNLFMSSSGMDWINKYGEKGDGEDYKGVVESDGGSDEEGEWSSSEQADDDEFSCDEQGEETDISSDGEEGYGQNKAGIHTNMIHVDVDTDDDQPDKRYSDFAYMKLSLSSILQR
jgi:hypothetical protein